MLTLSLHKSTVMPPGKWLLHIMQYSQLVRDLSADYSTIIHRCLHR